MYVTPTCSLFTAGHRFGIDAQQAQSFGVGGTPPDTIEIGQPDSTIIWNRDASESTSPPDDIQLGPPSTHVGWGKRSEAQTPPDSINLGPPSTVVTW
jgi:hypothetical protein